VSVLLGSENSFSQKLGRNRGTFMLWVTLVNLRNSFALFTSVSLSHIKKRKKMFVSSASLMTSAARIETYIHQHTSF